MAYLYYTSTPVERPAYKYLKQRSNDVSVTYILESAEKKAETSRAACYASLFRQVPEWVESILLKEKMDRVDFDESEIKRWVDDLNEMGFPCHLEGVDETVRIRLVMSEYKTKVQLASALSLLRLLWESGHTHVLEWYFVKLDEDPAADKIDVIQAAHKQTQQYTGHVITGINNGAANVDRKLLLERLSEGLGVHDRRKDDDYGFLDAAWRSPEAKPKGPYGGLYE